MSGMRARGWRRQGGIVSVTLCVRPGDGGTIVAIGGEVDVCTEAPLQQSLLRIIRECGAKLMLDVSGVSFMDCAGLRALLATRRRAELRGGYVRLIATSAAFRRIIELTGTHEALAGTILAEPSTKRGELVVAAMVALAVARWDSGRPAEALYLAAQAVRQATDRPYETTHFSPHMFLASALIQVRGLDEATAITDAFEVGNPRPEGITEVLRARIALAAGRLDDVVALAESASRRVEAGGRFAGDSLGVPVLAAVALRRGDLPKAAEYVQRMPAFATTTALPI